MKIAFNPSTVAALITPPNNKDITFDLRGRNIFARGVKFCGTDTWRDIKINNVSIDSNILDLRNGSNTTLTNTNGVVTINSTWRPVVDNLTSDSTTSSLSANQGRVLVGLINGKSDSGHNHDDRYVKKSGDTMSGVLTIDTTNFGALIIKRNDDTNGASIQFRGKSSVYGYIGLNNSTKDKQFLRWNSDTSKTYTILDTSSTYISNGKGVINGTTITQVDNATNSTNSTNARKLVNWYSARPTSLNTQFGDGSLRIFYATSSTTEGKPAEDSHILHLAWDNTGGWDAQLAIHTRSGKVSTRAQNSGTWQPWKTLAFTTDIPSSLKNPYSLTTFGVVYDGSAAKVVGPSNFISQVNEAASIVTDGTMFITSWASNSGFADTNAVNVPYKRKAIHLWEYIKAKTDSLYATKSHNHDNKYLRWLGNAGQSNMNAIGRISHSSGMTALSDPGNTIDNPMEGGSKSTSWHLYWQTNYTDDPSSSNAWVAQIVNRAGTDRWWVRSRSGGTITNGTNWTSNWRFLVTAPTSGLGNGNQPVYINSAGEVVAANSYPTTLPANGGNADTVDGEHASNFSYTHQTSFDFSKSKSGRIVTFDESNTDYGWINGFASTHNNYLTSVLFNAHRTSNWYVGYIEDSTSTGKTNGLQAVHKLAFVDQIPTSLKNPHALTISLNGTSQGPYDGSAAKNINITPGSIGAATSGHNHDGRYVYNYGGTQMDGASTNKNALGMAINSGITGDWWYILQAAWNGEYRWNSQIAFPTQNRNGMYYRSGLDDNTAWGSWVKLLDVNNYSSTLDSRYYTESEINTKLGAYLPLTGGTMTGNLSFSNSGTGFRGINYGTMGDNDQWRIGGAATGSNSGYMEIATADDGNEPIYVRQYTGVFSSVRRTLTLLDGSGNTTFPGSLSIGGNIIFPNSSHLLWNSGSWYQRILLTDDSTADTAVFTFQQSSDSGTNWSNLMTIRDNGKIIANTFVGDLQGNASTASKLQTSRLLWGQPFNGTANISGTLSGVAHIQFNANNTYDIGSNSAASRYIYTYWLGAKSGQKLELGANDSGYGQGLCIDTNLNVGIGTNTPTYKLHVAGDIYTTTGFKKNGSSDSYVLLGGGGHKTISSLSVNYANSAGNADTLDGVHLSGIFTAFGNNAHNITATIGGVTKSFLVNWAADSDKLDGYHANGLLTSVTNTNNGISVTVGGTTKSVSNISVNYAASAESASSATQATNLTPENTPHYFRDPYNSVWRGGMYWGNASSESMSFVAANSGTRFQFVGGSDIANWTNSTWQSVTPYLTIYSSGIVTPGSVTATNGFHHVNHDNNDAVLLAGGGYSQGVPVKYWSIETIIIYGPTSVVRLNRGGNYTFVTKVEPRIKGSCALTLQFPSGYNNMNTIIWAMGAINNDMSNSDYSAIYATMLHFSGSKYYLNLSDDDSLNNGSCQLYFMCF